MPASNGCFLLNAEPAVAWLTPQKHLEEVEHKGEREVHLDSAGVVWNELTTPSDINNRECSSERVDGGGSLTCWKAPVALGHSYEETPKQQQVLPQRLSPWRFKCPSPQGLVFKPAVCVSVAGRRGTKREGEN